MSNKMMAHYEIRKKIGQGGMANVFLAYDTHLEREVAIKVLEAYFAREPTFADRFELEAKTMTALEHSHIVPLYDYGNFKGLPYLVMRYMRGGSLAKRLENGPLSIDETSTIIKRVAAALDYAHEQGIIHRDLKPDNILFDLEDNAFLADFGIVKLAETSTTYTQTGNTLGTPAYMSPEQAIAQKELNHRSDIYSLGVILYEMLTGDIPYKADTNLGQAMMHVIEPVPSILDDNPHLPQEVETIIQKAMAKDSGERFATTSEMAQALAQISQSESTNNLISPSETAESVEPETASPLTNTVTESEIETEWDLPPASTSPFSPISDIQEPIESPTIEKKPAIMPPNGTPSLPPSPAKTAVLPDSAQNEQRSDFNLWWLLVPLGGLLAAVIAFALWQNNVSEAANGAASTQTAQALTLTHTEEAAAATAAAATAAVATAAAQDKENNSTPTLTPSPSATPTPTRTPTSPPLLGIGSTRVRPADNMVMVFVPAGSFLLGSDTAVDPNWESDETPQNNIRLDSFWMDKTEVTNAQFAQFVQSTNYQTTAETEGVGTVFTGANFVDVNGADWEHPTGPTSSNNGLDNHPVVMVSWFDANAYCEWADGQLPTEAQWEYAARSQNSFIFPWGNTWPSCSMAKFGECNGRTFSVGSFSPAGDSWVGANDMAGNVWEWVSDWYDETYYDEIPQTNPTGPRNGEKKIHKGGSWGSNPVLLRAAVRGDNDPENRFDLVGFRCAAPNN